MSEFTITRTYDATPADLYAAWTDPEQWPVWSGAAPWSTGRCEMDVRVGGKYLLETIAPDNGGTFTFSGEYTELVPNEKYACTTDMTGPDGAKYMDGCICEVTFREVEPDKTEMTLHNDNIADDESAAVVKQGWEEGGLNDLETFLAKRKANA